MDRRLKISDLRGGAALGGHRPPLQRRKITKRTHSGLRYLRLVAGNHASLGTVFENYQTNPISMDRRFQIPDLRWRSPVAPRLGAAADIYTLQRGNRARIRGIRLDPTFEIFMKPRLCPKRGAMDEKQIRGK